MGRAKYIVFYLFCGYMAIVVHTLYTLALNRVDLITPVVGASGAISGLIAAYLYLYPASRIWKCFCIRFSCMCVKVKMKYFILFWIILQMIIPLIEPRVAVFAHMWFYMWICINTTLRV